MIRNVARDIVSASIRGVVQVAAASGPTERITNGDFAAGGTGWGTPTRGTIVAGSPGDFESTGLGGGASFVTQTLGATLLTGVPVDVSANVLQNLASGTMLVIANPGAQTLLSVVSPTAGVQTALGVVLTADCTDITIRWSNNNSVAKVTQISVKA